MRINSFHPAAWTMAAVASGFAGSAQAAPTRHSLDDTGLTTCLDTTTWQPTACAGTGQDGEFGRDVTHPRHRDGLAGFSFVKVCNSGKMAVSERHLPAT